MTWPAAVAMRLAAGSGDRGADGYRADGRSAAAATGHGCLPRRLVPSRDRRVPPDGREGDECPGRGTAAIDGLQPAVFDSRRHALFALAARVAGDQAEFPRRAADDDDTASRHRSIVERGCRPPSSTHRCADAAVPWPEATRAFVGLLAAESGRAYNSLTSRRWTDHEPVRRPGSPISHFSHHSPSSRHDP